jgi:hypothetical protein
VDVEEFVVLHLPQAPARILEVGCGTGELALALAKRGHDLTPIDPEALDGSVFRKASLEALLVLGRDERRDIAHEGGAYNRVAGRRHRLRPSR